MKIETKFNVGAVVYVCKNNSTYKAEDLPLVILPEVREKCNN